MGQKIIRTGNSIAVTLPSKLVKALGLKSGDPVEVKVNYIKGEVVFKFPSARQLPLETKKGWK
jgi:antitoxin component of MazEF toxin-antitoxin module